VNTELSSKINALIEHSQELWELAVETCVEPSGRVLRKREERARADAVTANSLYERIREVVSGGDITVAIQHAEEARTLTREWGDDQYERAILHLLFEHQIKRMTKSKGCSSRAPRSSTRLCRHIARR
jgi:hypothetical protein